MNKVLILSLAAFSIFSFSCTKKAGKVKACFTFSKSPAKVNDTVFLLNCSENYAKFKWIIPPAKVDSIFKHNYFITSTPGDYTIGLLVWSLNGADTTSVVQKITVK